MNEKSDFRFQRNITVFGIVLFLGKLMAWNITNSNAIFSDAMESIVNIVTAFMGLYALRLASKPRDDDHPYGHGKIEFITAGIEGILIVFAGFLMIIQAVQSVFQKNDIQRLDWGILIVLLTAIVNYILGCISLNKGEKKKSIVLVSSGKHLQSDTMMTLGVILGLGLVYWTKIYWIDGLMALFFGGYSVFIGFGIVRKSLKGIMDEKDDEVINEIVEILKKNRQDKWIDIHNLKVQQFGAHLHIDAHVTLPFYYSLRQAHDEMSNIIKILSKNIERSVEFNFHMDDCKNFSCEICNVKECPWRNESFQRIIEWNAETLSHSCKHNYEKYR